MPSQVIAFTVSGLRQKYLREALGTWGRARGIEDWHLLFSLEPCRTTFPVAEFTQWAKRVFASAEVAVADSRLGCLRNTRQAMRLAFASGAEFAILAEEDLLVSTDVLEYFTWARDTYGGQEKVTTVCAHSLRTERGGPADVVRSSWFNPLVWGTWKDRWEDFIDPAWGPFDGNSESWDNNLRMQVHSAGRESRLPGVLPVPAHRADFFHHARPAGRVLLQGRAELQLHPGPGAAVLPGDPVFGEARPAGLIRGYQGA